MSQSYPEMLVALVEDAFAVGGPLERFLARSGKPYRPSDVQLEYARSVAGVLSSPITEKGAPVGLLEAETGTGKSFGYLIPLTLHCALSDCRGAVSTFTIQLLHQLLSTEVPISVQVAEDLTGKSLSFARRIGVRNFLSAPRIAALSAALKVDRTADRSLLPVLEALETAALDGLALMDWTERHGPLPAGINPRDVTLTSADEDGSHGYVDHVENSHAARILLVSHALTALDLTLYGRVMAASGRDPISALIIDEADTLPSVIRSHHQVHLSTLQLVDAASSFKGANRTRFEAAVKRFKDATSEVVHSLPRNSESKRRRSLNLGDHRNDAERTRFRGIAQDLLKEVNKGIKSLGKGGFDNEVGQLLSYERELRSFADACDKMSDYNIPSIAFSPVLSVPAFSVIPMQSSRVASRLWREDQKTGETLRSAIVFTSATLGPPSQTEGFREFCSDVGLIDQFHNIRHDYSGRFAPEQFGRMTFRLAGPDAPRPTVSSERASEGYELNEAWVDYVARTIRLAHQSDTRVLVLANSFADSERIAAALNDLAPHVHAQRAGEPLSDVVSLYQSDEKGILISPSCWEGLNLPGLNKNIVVTRMPIQSFGNSTLGMYRDVLLSRGKSETEATSIVMGLAMNDAMRKLKQGFGRGIRAYDDETCVWITDPRFPLPDRLRATRSDDPSNKRYALAISDRFREKRTTATYPRARLIFGENG